MLLASDTVLVVDSENLSSLGKESGRVWVRRKLKVNERKSKVLKFSVSEFIYLEPMVSTDGFMKAQLKYRLGDGAKLW